MTDSELTQNKEGNLTYKKGTDKKANEDHICTKEAVLARLSTNITSIHTNISEIKEDVKEVNSQYRELLVEVTKVEGSLSAFKGEVAAAVLASDKGFSKTTKIIGIIIAIIMMFFAYQGLTKRVNNVEAKITNSIDNMDGVSKVTRDGFVKYNDQGLSDSIKIK